MPRDFDRFHEHLDTPSSRSDEGSAAHPSGRHFDARKKDGLRDSDERVERPSWSAHRPREERPREGFHSAVQGDRPERSEFRPRFEDRPRHAVADREIEERPTNVVYGIHPAEEILTHGRNRIDRMYFEQGDHGIAHFELLKRARKDSIPCQVVPRPKLDWLCPRDANHQGVVVVCGERAYDDMETLLGKIQLTPAPLILVPASVEDTRNLGAIIRSAAAFNVTGILVERKNSAPLNAGTAKSAAGMLEQVTIVKPSSLEKEIGELKAKGFRVIGAEGKAEKHCFEETCTGPLILIIGGEHAGIPPYLRRLCDGFVSIPIAESVDSLNVSAAAAVLLYEVTRQRH